MKLPVWWIPWTGVLESNRYESGGGYSGGGRGSLVHKSCAKKNIISGGSYGQGRTGHGSHGEPFPVEFLVPMQRWALEFFITVTESRIIRKHNNS